nr:hypothetical protein [Paracraurococcus ruber]
MTCIAASASSASRQPSQAIKAAPSGTKTVPVKPVTKVMPAMVRFGSRAVATTTAMAGPQSAAACARPMTAQMPQ